MIKAIILDVDDTILDYSRNATKIYIEASKNSKVKAPRKNLINKMYGIPWKVSSKKLYPGLNKKKLIRLRNELDYLFRINVHRFKLFNGALHSLRELRKCYKLGLISSKPHKIMWMMFNHIHFPKWWFEFIYAAEDLRYDKPDGRAFSKGLKKLNLNKHEVIFVGDSIYDAKTAKHAKIRFVSVLTGHYSKRDFLKFGVKKNNILKSVKYLPRWVDKND
ncbi:MAG TPA: HAD family hydrolase [Candidatus Nanoarchaeia archaeon]|nr:HAD family hydrolase [Candidatus Nanoarchaeia archaeon]